MAAMAIDHVGYVFFPHAQWLRFIGRLTFPIIAFLISEGFFYTRSRKKYLLRLFLFGIIAQAPYSAAFNSYTGNVMFTLAACVLILYMYEGPFKPAIKYPVMAAAFAAAYFCDWSFWAVFFVCSFYFNRGSFKKQAFRVTVITLAMTVVYSYTYGFANRWWILGILLSLPLLWLYSGKRGPDLRWAFYAFYPLHLAVIACFRFMLF